MKKYNNLREYLENLWYYNKTVIVIGLVVLLAGLYLGLQNIHRVEPDYTVAAVTPTGLSDADKFAIQESFSAYGADLNGDGIVRVDLQSYRLDFTGATASAYEAIAGLDADLVGQVSGIFLLAQPEEFLSSTGSAGEMLSLAGYPAMADYSSVLTLFLRADHPQADEYAALLAEMSH